MDRSSLNTGIWLCLGYAALMGAMLPVQAGSNVRLGQFAPSMWHATMVNFAIGFASLAVVVLGVMLFGAKPEPGSPQANGFAGMLHAPWWAWIGGVLGAAYVSMTIIAAPKLGAVMLLAATVGGQLIGSMIVDHYGLLGFAVREVTPGRIVGLLLLCAGIVLMKIY